MVRYRFLYSIKIRQIWTSSPGADPGFQVKGGALKKNCWGISCENFYFFPILEGAPPPWIRPCSPSPTFYCSLRKQEVPTHVKYIPVLIMPDERTYYCSWLFNCTVWLLLYWGVIFWVELSYFYLSLIHYIVWGDITTFH
jgi:hypothetical protein